MYVTARSPHTMPDNKTVRINNRLYDAATGLPVDTPAPAEKKPAERTPTTAKAVHATPQRSKTLHRRSTKKPGLPKRPKPGTHMDIARSASVARFAQHPVTASPAPKVVDTPDVPHKTHPVAAKATAKTVKKAAPASAKQVKDAAIAKALASEKKTVKKEKKARSRKLSWTRRRAIIAAIALLLLSAAAVTYFNLPRLSVAWASTQAGIDADFPKYTPDGYRLSNVSYGDGEVSLDFASNGTQKSYTITQSSSSWDSTAVLDNVVREAVGENYIINQEQGLRIYTYDNNAAWVTGGVLYVIDSEATLSGDQLRRIATSL
jgi:hypothetical protein